MNKRLPSLRYVWEKNPSGIGLMSCGARTMSSNLPPAYRWVISTEAPSVQAAASKEYKGRWCLFRNNDPVADVVQYTFVNIEDEMITRFYARLALCTPEGQDEDWKFIGNPHPSLAEAQDAITINLVESYLGRG